MKSFQLLILTILAMILMQLGSHAQSTASMRRSISPNQPMWLVHIDTWNYADPQKIIDLIPQDIRPYVVMNISVSISQQDAAAGNYNFKVAEYGYEIAKSWVRTCAQNNMWCMIQQSSGGYQHFSDFDLSIYEEFFRTYPNVLGFNYAEQFWGFDEPANPASAAWTDRINHFADLLGLCNKYGGYLVVSWCGNQFSNNINPIGMLKRNPTFEQASRDYTENFILCEKYTTVSYQHDKESVCLGAYLSGYSGHYGIRYDSSGWTDTTGVNQNYTLSTGGAPQLEHMMLTGETVVDGPELIFTDCFRELSTGAAGGGYTTRRWDTYPQFNNVSVDLFRKVLDGTVRIPSRQEVINRTKFVIINNDNTGTNDNIYSSPDTLFEGLYRMDGDGNYQTNKSFFKKTGRYPAIPTVYQLDDTVANTFQYKVNRTAYSSRWPTIAAKTTEFNGVFPQEYTGDIYAGRHENGWVVYNPFKTGQTASGSIPFKYNTCDHVDLGLSQYSSGVMKEFSNSVTFYLCNYDDSLNLGLKTDTIAIYGSASEPTYSWTDRASHQASTVTKSWSDGVWTLTVQHDGPIDITVNCAGTGTGRLTAYTTATLVAPNPPMAYTGALQYEGECFDYKSIGGIVSSGWDKPVRNYTGQGYLQFGTGSTAAVRETVTVLKAGTYRLETRYSNMGANRSNIHLYVNGADVATPVYATTPSYSDWGVSKQNINLNAGANTIELRALSTGDSVYFDNIVVVPTSLGENLVIQENQTGFAGVEGTIDTSNGGYSGSGYANSRDSISAGTVWTANFATSATKSFTFRYACVSDFSADLFVNGSNVASGILFPSTGSLSVWDYVTVYASIPAGDSVLRLQASSDLGLPNLDSLELTGATAWSPTLPYTPQGLVATSVSISQIDLTWQISPGAVGYNVKRATADGGPYTTIATGVTGTAYNDVGLSQLTTYYYVVSAVNPGNESANSHQAGATTKSTEAPQTPTNLVAVGVAYDQADLSWTAASGAESYIVKRSITNGGPYITIAIGVTGTTYHDSGLFANTNYYYVVTAVNSKGEGPVSTQATAATLNTAIIEPIADTFVRDGSSANTPLGSDLRLVSKSDGNIGSGFNRNAFLKFDLNPVANALSASMKLTPVQVDGSGANLNFELVTDDNWSEAASTWNTQPSGSGTVVATRNFTNSDVGNRISLNVTSVVQSQAAGDRILSMKVSDPSITSNYVGFNSREVAIAGSRPVLECILPHVNHPLPAAPTGLAATATGNSQINLTWAAPSGATGYNVMRAMVSGGPYTLIAAGVTGTSFSDTSLTANSTYHYVVTAINGTGESVGSQEITAALGPMFVNLRMDDGSGTAATDSTGNGWNGTLVNSPTWVGGTNAKVKGALRLTAGSSNYVSFQPGILGNLSDFTIAFWVNLNSVSTWARVFDFSTGTTQNSMYFTPRTSGNVARFGLRVNGVAQNLESTAPLTANVWTHVAVTLAGSTATMYFNGSPVATSTTMTNRPSGLGNTTANSLGKSASSDPYIDGRIDEFKIFSSALAPEEISTLSSMPTVSANLIATSGHSQVALGWNPINGVNNYTVKRSTTSGGPYVSISTVSNTAYTDQSVTNGTTYFYIVTANGGLADGGSSLEVTGQPMKLAATVTLGNLAATYDGTPKPAIVTTSPAGLSVNLTYNGSATIPTAAGSYPVSAVISDANYQGNGSGTLVIAKSIATVTLDNLAATYDGTPKPATAITSPAGLAVNLTYDGSATIPTAAGSYAVSAVINDANYQGNNTGTLIIGKGVATVTLDNLTATYDGTPKPATAITSPAGLSVNLTYNGSATIPTAAGSYPVSAVINDANYQGSNTGTLVINPRSFTTWESMQFSQSQIVAGDSNPDADPDGDLLTNLAEYAMGSDPHSFTPQPVLSKTPTGLRITFQRPAHIGDVIYHAEASDDMVTWEDLIPEVQNPGSDPETLTATKTFSTPMTKKQFIRLRFAQANN